jgi:NAD(P)-dependent dehydrogenase (short-subunit alcohol dehydrogenase family)
MLLAGKNAVVHGGGGAIGGAVARAFAREGANVFLAGRTQAALARVAEHVLAAGGAAETAVVDVLDEQAVAAHADAVAAKAGSIDVALNAVGFHHDQGTPLPELSLAAFELPLHTYMRACFTTSKAVARHMTENGSGVILTLTTPATRMSIPGCLGYGATCGAVEAFSRMLAAEVGPSGVRVVCLRPDAIPGALPTSHVQEVFENIAQRHGTTVEAMTAERAQAGTLLGRFPTLEQVAEFATFAASDRAGAMTGAIVNLTCGSVVD